jgi:hypothetical protein
LRTRKGCFKGNCGLVGINFVNRVGWREDIVHISVAITVRCLINSSLDLTGMALLLVVSDKLLAELLPIPMLLEINNFLFLFLNKNI